MCRLYKSLLEITVDYWRLLENTGDHGRYILVPNQTINVTSLGFGLILNVHFVGEKSQTQHPMVELALTPLLGLYPGCIERRKFPWVCRGQRSCTYLISFNNGGCNWIQNIWWLSHEFCVWKTRFSCSQTPTQLPILYSSCVTVRVLVYWLFTDECHKMKPIFSTILFRVVSPSPAANPYPSGWLRMCVALPCVEGREGLSTAHVHDHQVERG